MPALRPVLFLSAGLAVAAGLGAAGGSRFAPDDPSPVADPHRLATPPVAVDGAAAAQWFDMEWAWIGVTGDGDGAPVAHDVRAAIAAFYRYFGRRPDRGAVVDLDYAALAPALASAGATWLLPWPFRIEGMPGEPGTDGDARSALRHEIGHALFLSVMVPNTRGNQYGGDAPDWLDEAAAMLVETPATLSARRERFAAAAAAERLSPLHEIIAARHPLYGDAVLGGAVADARRNSGDPVVLKVDASRVRVDREVLADFYASALGVAEYLMERSGDERILAVVASLARDDESGTAWLRRLCETGKLPVAFDAVDADFAAWAKSRVAGI